MFSINPGPMQNQKEYQFHAKLMYNIVNNYDSYKSGETFWIRDGVSNDIVHESLQCRSLSA